MDAYHPFSCIVELRTNRFGTKANFKIDKILMNFAVILDSFAFATKCTTYVHFSDSICKNGGIWRIFFVVYFFVWTMHKNIWHRTTHIHNSQPGSLKWIFIFCFCLFVHDTCCCGCGWLWAAWIWLYVAPWLAAPFRVLKCCVNVCCELGVCTVYELVFASKWYVNWADANEMHRRRPA